MNYNNIDGEVSSELRDAMMGEPPLEMDDEGVDEMLEALAKEYGEEDEDVIDVNHPDEGWFYNDKY